MDLRKEWQQLHQQKFNYSPIEKEQIMKAIYQESNSAIATLRKRLGVKINFIIFFTIAIAIWILFSLNRPELLIILGILFVFYATGLIMLNRYHRKMKSNFNFSSQTLALMKEQDELMRKALNFERIWGLIFFPIAAVSGMLVALHYKGRMFADLFQDPSFLLKALVCVAILAPLGYYLSEKMNNSANAFGPLMSNLQNNIRRMEDLT